MNLRRRPLRSSGPRHTASQRFATTLVATAYRLSRLRRRLPHAGRDGERVAGDRDVTDRQSAVDVGRSLVIGVLVPPSCFCLVKPANMAHESPQSFPQELAAQFTRWSALTGITVEVWALPKEELSGDVATLIQDTIRGVFSAIEQHARARTVSIALTLAAGGIRLTVSDDGGDMPVDQLESRLTAERAKFAALGGGLTINVVKLEGATVSAAIPRSALRAE
ncbi:hypothetical protein GCM10022224_066730 [Nonomuraea antimicrobica]|uniref:Histidine kinase/HSP90-like ATPase domain-containing protein n=2 Tax=Nonomuraea antimicrobica TaxID=561173 RepID=A0ABP7CJN7_9ACTN